MLTMIYYVKWFGDTTGFCVKEIISTGKLVKIIGNDYDELILLDIDVNRIKTTYESEAYIKESWCFLADTGKTNYD